MKWIGLLLITAAGAGLGWCASRQMTRRVADLGSIQHLMEVLLRQMTYTTRPVSQLWQQLAADEGPKRCFLVVQTAAYLSRYPFAEAFRQAVEDAVGEGRLQAEEQQVLLSFSREWGQYDMERQTAQIRDCIRQLSHLRQEAAEQAKAKGKIYQVAGVAGGMALALLLL